MKKFLFVACVAFAALGAHAQNAKVVTAYNYLKFEELDKAKEAIDEAVLNEKTMGSAKAWYYRGKIYFGLATNKTYANLSEGALNESLRSYSKSLDLDPASEYAAEIKQSLNAIKVTLFNEGVANINSKNYAAAAANFEGAINVMNALRVAKSDSLYMFSSLYSGMAYMQDKKYDKARLQFSSLMELKYRDPKIYTNLANLYRLNGDTAQALNIIQSGRKEFPTDNVLLIEELNFYLGKGNAQEAVDRINLAIVNDPKNANLYLALGTMYDKLNNFEKAVQAYKKAIELNPNMFDPYYNLGATYFNQGAELNNKANDIKDNVKYEAAIKKANDVLKESIPYFEKALEISPNDMNTLNSLKQIYVRTNDTANYNKIKLRIEAQKK